MSSGPVPITFQRASELLEEGGILHLFTKAAVRLASPWTNFGSIVFVAWDLDVDRAVHSGGSTQLRLATASDLPLLRACSYPADDDPAARFARGDLCVIALDEEGRLAHYRWASVAGEPRIPELDLLLQLAPCQAYMYDGYTRPDLRGRGISNRASQFALSVLRDRGFRVVLAYVRGDNPVGFRATRDARKLGKLWYLRPPLSETTLVAGWHKRLRLVLNSAV